MISEETREKLRKAATGRKQSPETIAKRISKCKGRKRSDSFRKTMSLMSYKRYGYDSIDKSLSYEERQRYLSRNNFLKKKYGISIDEYQMMHDKQNGKCAICGIPQEELDQPLYVDHCHTTNVIRGLLCMKCNMAIGLFNDNIQNFQNAVNYLTAFGQLN